uniref:Signal peptidase complex catalytic subunit SEC11 n=1 Tax=Balaenoptera musculus TaxID=9771 RepID=A0A8C0HVQ7_BALMU
MWKEGGIHSRRGRGDPAMASLDFLDDVQWMNKRQLYYLVLNFGKIVSSALMLRKGLTVRTGSESPAVVLLSGSMERAFHRGAFLFLANRVEDHPVGVEEITENHQRMYNCKLW